MGTSSENSDPHTSDAPSWWGGPAVVFAVELFYLLVLIVLFIVYRSDASFRNAIPALGEIPVQVVWFGAAGAVLSGLSGVYYHNADWNRSYDFWHYSRPFVGAVVGGVGALLYYVSIDAGSQNVVQPDHLTFYTVAFVLGFADEAFRSLIGKVTTLLIAPGSSTPSGSGANNTE